jgi:hypothetical protein
MTAITGFDSSTVRDPADGDAEAQEKCHGHHRYGPAALDAVIAVRAPVTDFSLSVTRLADAVRS